MAHENISLTAMPSMLRTLFSCAVLMLVLHVAPAEAQDQSVSTCASDFTFLTEEVSQNYAAFRYKTRSRENELAALTDSIRSVVQESPTSPEQCTSLLERWLAFFNDLHLWLRTDSPQESGESASSGNASTANSQNPSLRFLDEQTAYFRVPSFHLRHKRQIDSLLQAEWSELTHTPNLIVDIRGNGGGGDPAFSELLPLLYTGPVELKGMEVWVTEDNIEHFTFLTELDEMPESSKKALRVYLDRMRGNEGSFVTLAEDRTTQPDTTYRNPRSVAILIDGRVGSAAEQFLTHARQSSKTALLGERTAGAIDYANLSTRELPSGTRRVGIPTTRSRRLPEDPIDPEGIEPDVFVPEGVEDWIAFARGYLSRVSRGAEK